MNPPPTLPRIGDFSLVRPQPTVEQRAVVTYQIPVLTSRGTTLDLLG